MVSSILPVLELMLSVDMVSEAETKNVLEIQCVVPASDIKQLDKAEVYLNNQEIITTEGGRVMTARDRWVTVSPHSHMSYLKAICYWQ